MRLKVVSDFQPLHLVSIRPSWEGGALAVDAALAAPEWAQML